MTFYLPTSSQVRLSVHGVDLDLAFRLDWKESSPKIPIYGYNDHVYTRTIRGRTMIQGYLVMNYIAPHYLSAILENWDVKEQKMDKARLASIMAELPAPTNFESRKARAEMLVGLIFPQGGNNSSLVDKVDPPSFWEKLRRIAKRGSPGLLDAARRKGLAPRNEVIGDFKKKLIDEFTKGGMAKTSVPKIAGPGEYKTPFDLSIYHMEPEFSNWYVLLRDVEITDVSQTISSSGAEGSSDPLYETYEFIARSRVIKDVARPSTKETKPGISSEK